MTGDTRSLLVLPLFHVNGIMVSVVSPLLAGGSAFIAERFHAASFWATVEQVRPTFFSAVPDHLRAADVTARRAAGHPEPALRHLRRRADAAPADRRVRAAVRRPRRRGLRAVGVHGRAAPPTRCTASARRVASGLPLPGIDVGVVDGSDHAAACRAGRRGGRPRAERHARLPRAAGGVGPDAARRMAAHRRRRPVRRRRLPHPGRPGQGPDHPGRGEHLPEGDRGRPLRPSRRCSRPRSSASPIRCSASSP